MRNTVTAGLITLGEAVDFVFEHTGRRLTEKEILFHGAVSNDALPIYGVCRNFVMTEPVAFQSDISNKRYGSKPPSIALRKMTQRSFVRGEVFQLHPKFIERLIQVGELSSEEFPPHTVTHAVSPRPRSGWSTALDSVTGMQIWKKTFDAAFYSPTETITIGHSDLRVDKADLLICLNIASTQKGDAAISSLQNWKHRIQAEAALRWARAMASGATPTKNNLKSGLETWCRENNVRTEHGVCPTAEYIARHVLRDWKPPV